MKNILLPSLLFLVFSCSNESGSSAQTQNKPLYVITGRIANAMPGSPVFFDKLSYLGNQTIDTAILASDGTFTMQGNKKLPHTLYSLRITPDRAWVFIAGNNQPITIQADFNTPDKATITGAENEKLTHFINKVNRLRASLQQYQNEYLMAQMTGDVNKMTDVQNKYNSAVNEYNHIIKMTIDTTSHPLIALLAATMLNMEQHAAYLDEVAPKISARLPDNDLAKEFVTKLKGETALAIGKIAPDFTLKTAKGETISLKDVKGKVVLLDFWASWCRPCRMENPNVVRLYHKYKDKGFTVFSVSLDNNLEKWVNAIQQDGLAWPYHGSNLLGWQCPVAQLYKVNSIPNTYLIDRDGRIIGKNLRGIELENKLRELFGS